jgi:mannose-6-phosphate isomerase-like protein (cupin superfamily)
MRRNVVKVVEKPWGRELWLAVEEEYAGKILEVNKGHRLSLQYHREKKESLYVLGGRVRLVGEGADLVLKKGDSVTIDPKVVHRIEALSNAKIVEFSTPQLCDVVRLEDDYKR